MTEPSAQPQKQAAEATELSLLDQIVERGRFGGEAPARERGRDMIKQFVSEVLAGTITIARDTEAMLNARIAQIDRLITNQVNEVVHHPEFQKLEATWRGLRYLLSNSETSETLKVKVLNVSKKDLLKDLQRAPSSTRARCSRRCTRRSSGSSAAHPSARCSGTTTSTRRARTSSYSRRSLRWRPPRMRPSSPAHRPRCSVSTASRSSTPRGTWRRSF